MLGSGWTAPIGHLLGMGPGGQVGGKHRRVSRLSLSAPADLLGALANRNEPELPQLS
jgi:hypothetical protein